MLRSKYSYVAVLMLMFAATACQTDKRPASDNHFVVDLSGVLSRDKIDEFQSKIEGRLMSLETNDSSLFNGSAVTVIGVGNDILLSEATQSCILRFDADGRFLNKIGSKGGGDKEYTGMLNVTEHDGKIYVVDWKRIQVYDLEGNWLKSIDGVEGERAQLEVGDNNRLYFKNGYQNDFQLLVCDSSGTLIHESFPSREIVRGFSIPKGPAASIGRYSDGIYVAHAMDNTIYQVSDTSQSVLATFDLGRYNLPDDFFNGTTDEVHSRFWKLRNGDNGNYAAVFIDYVTVSDNWVNFMPEMIRDDYCGVFCDRRTGTSYRSLDLDSPYNKFMRYAPDGYNSATDEFYNIVSVSDVKELLEKAIADYPDYAERFPFFKDLKPDMIDDEDNDWLFFYKLK